MAAISDCFYLFLLIALFSTRDWLVDCYSSDKDMVPSKSYNDRSESNPSNEIDTEEVDEEDDDVDDEDTRSETSSADYDFDRHSSGSRYLDEYVRDFVEEKVAKALKEIKFHLIPWWNEKGRRFVRCEHENLIRKMYNLCYSQYTMEDVLYEKWDKADREFEQLSGEEKKSVKYYGSHKTCCPDFCRLFKQTLEDLNMCTQVDSTFESGNFVVDSENVLCYGVQNILRSIKNDFCLCAFKDYTKMAMVAYIIHEPSYNRGIYHYMRLEERTINFVSSMQDKTYSDKHIRVNAKHWTIKNLFVRYRNLFDMKTYKTSDCQVGILQMVPVVQQYSGSELIFEKHHGSGSSHVQFEIEHCY